MRKRYRVLMFVALVAALVVPVGYALSVESMPVASYARFAVVPGASAAVVPVAAAAGDGGGGGDGCARRRGVARGRDARAARAQARERDEEHVQLRRKTESVGGHHHLQQLLRVRHRQGLAVDARAQLQDRAVDGDG